MYAYENIEKTLNYIEEHLNEKIETVELAKMAGLSMFYYQRVFKRFANKSVQEYIKLRRLAHVITELKHTNNRILDIALKYGFSDHANFTRAFKEVYHMTPDEYKKTLPMLNTFDKPELSSRYILIDENTPMMVGDIVLEIHRKVLKDDEIYFGFEKEVQISHQIPVGESTGIDVPGQLWKEFRNKKNSFDKTIFNKNVEMGVSFLANPEKGTFLYFVGAMVCVNNPCIEGMDKHILPSGEYIVCRIEAESFEQLVTHALNQANRYLFETWLPKHQLTTKPFMAEKYYEENAGIYYMELWVCPIEDGRGE